MYNCKDRKTLATRRKPMELPFQGKCRDRGRHLRRRRLRACRKRVRKEGQGRASQGFTLRRSDSDSYGRVVERSSSCCPQEAWPWQTSQISLHGLCGVSAKRYHGGDHNLRSNLHLGALLRVLYHALRRHLVRRRDNYSYTVTPRGPDGRKCIVSEVRVISTSASPRRARWTMSVGSECLRQFAIKCLLALVQSWPQLRRLRRPAAGRAGIVGFRRPSGTISCRRPHPEARQRVGSAAWHSPRAP